MNKNKKVKLRVSLYMGLIGLILTFFFSALVDNTTNNFLFKILIYLPISIVTGLIWFIFVFISISWYQALLETEK